MSATPFISVVVPTCHRNDLLAKCLDCLAPGKQRLDSAEYEVIVSDDGRHSTAQAMIERDYAWVRWEAGPKDGPAANRNNGARKGRGQWVTFTDDDCLPDAGWLESIVKVAREGRVDVIEGRTLIPDYVDSPFKQGIENRDGGVFWSCNLAVRRALFLEMGGFDEDFKEAADEDMEFAFRFRQRGHPHCFVFDALVLHPVRDVNWLGIWKRTKMARWHELLFLKRNPASATNVAGWRVAAGTVWRATVNLVRTTWHLFSKHDPHAWRTRWFWQAWRWLTFPFLAPYLVFWQFRFRRMLHERNAPASR